MHRCSETIGAIAATLAKVQAELTSPEKSLTAAAHCWSASFVTRAAVRSARAAKGTKSLC
jgi:hypothetical protein